MSSGLDKLKDIGAQKIYEQTHISKEHVQAILHESFDGLNKVQFLGFISILEREYATELSDVKSKGLSFFEQLPKYNKKDESDIFISSRESKNNTKIYVAIAVILILMAALYFTINDSFKSEENIDNSLIQSAKEKVQQKNQILDDNLEKETKDINVSQEDIIVPKEEVKIEEEVVVDSLKIFPKSKLWMGYIELNTNRHYQKIFDDSIELDTAKDWLLLLGHGSVKIEVNGEIKEFNNKGNLRFLYQNSHLKDITTEEFKELNKGKKW